MWVLFGLDKLRTTWADNFVRLQGHILLSNYLALFRHLLSCYTRISNSRMEITSHHSTIQHFNAFTPHLLPRLIKFITITAIHLVMYHVVFFAFVVNIVGFYLLLLYHRRDLLCTSTTCLFLSFVPNQPYNHVCKWNRLFTYWSSSCRSVSFWPMHHSLIAHGGIVPAGSSPASVRSRATTPWGGTARAVKLRTAVPLSVWVHRSYRDTESK